MNETTNVVVNEGTQDEIIIEVTPGKEECLATALVGAGLFVSGWICKTIYDKAIKPAGAKLVSKLKKKPSNEEISEKTESKDTQDDEE